MAVVTALSGSGVELAQLLRETQFAFDGVAATYDQSNAANVLLCAMRERTRAALERLMPSGSRLLDLGCGPGTDVVYFAKKGFRVTAIDSSAAMVDQAIRSLRAAGLEGNDGQAAVQHLAIEDVGRGGAFETDWFDAAYSSFGPLNCVPDLFAAARAIAGRVRDGGALIASVIGRICPWEWAVFAARRDFGRAAIRFSRERVPVPLQGRTVWTQYYTPVEFARTFTRAGFQLLSCRALGLFTPPPYLDEFAGRHPRLMTALQRVEDLAGGWPGMRSCGDHFLIVMRRAQRG